MREGFAERFKQALDEAGYGSLHLTELGEMFGVTPQAVRKWKMGEAIPTAQRAPLVAQKLGVRRSWLLDNELPIRVHQVELAEKGHAYSSGHDALSISRTELKLLNDYRNLPQNLRHLVEQLAEVMNKEQRRK